MPKQEGEDYSIVTDAFYHLQAKFMAQLCMHPFSTFNDGLIDIFFWPVNLPVSKHVKANEQALAGGLHMYEYDAG